MAQATSYNVSGNREDLTDFLTRLDPEETPVLSSLNKSSRPSGVYQEWQMDSLDNPSFDGVVEGADVANFDNKGANRARTGNYIQKFRRSWAVSDIQEAIDTAGVSSEVAASKAKCMAEMKRDIESAICSDNEMQTDDGTVGYKLRGLGKWIQAVPSAYLTPTGSINTTATSSLEEVAHFNAVLQSFYETHGSKKSLKLFAGPSLKKSISGYTRSTGSSGTTKTYQVTQGAKEHRIDFHVEVYDGDFGIVTIIPTLFNGRVSGGGLTDQVRARGYLLADDLVSLGYLKGMSGKELDDEGGGRRGYVDAIVTLMVKNPKGLGKFAATS
jgi:hypothetical protein